MILEVESESQPAIEAGLESATHGNTDVDRGSELGRIGEKIATESSALGLIRGVEANRAQAGTEKRPYPALIVREEAHEVELNLTPR